MELSKRAFVVLECARSTIELSVRWFVTISPGTRFDRYGILAQLGVGGRGEVYLAQDTKLDRKVALKILPAQVTT
jgi:serine/threonine protein kinase